MRQGFWVHLPGNKNGLTHPFVSQRPTEPHSSGRAGFSNFLFNGRFLRSKKQPRNFHHAGISPSPAFLILVPIVYLCLIPVSLMLSLYIYLQIHTLYGIISPVDQPLSPVSFPPADSPSFMEHPDYPFLPFPHPAISSLFFFL